MFSSQAIADNMMKVTIKTQNILTKPNSVLKFRFNIQCTHFEYIQLLLILSTCIHNSFRVHTNIVHFECIPTITLYGYTEAIACVEKTSIILQQCNAILREELV